MTRIAESAKLLLLQALVIAVSDPDSHSWIAIFAGIVAGLGIGSIFWYPKK